MPGGDELSPGSLPTDQSPSCGCEGGTSACRYGNAATHAADEISPPRRELLTRGLRLEYFTVGWNVIEGLSGWRQRWPRAVMWWLARAKRRTARGLGSRALEADSFQTTACFWLSLITLAGVGLNTAFGWWWADPAAALGMTYFLVSEGRKAWRGEDCGCD